MIVVHLNRAHSFTNLKSVQDDLSAFVMELAPPELDPGAQVWNEMCWPFSNSFLSIRSKLREMRK